MNGAEGIILGATSVDLVAFGLAVVAVLLAGYANIQISRLRKLIPNGGYMVVENAQIERLDRRMDDFELLLQQQRKEDATFRRTLIEVSDAQLKATKDQNSMVEKVLRRTQYLAGVVESLSCVNLEKNDGS